MRKLVPIFTGCKAPGAPCGLSRRDKHQEHGQLAQDTAQGDRGRWHPGHQCGTHPCPQPQLSISASAAGPGLQEGIRGTGKQLINGSWNGRGLLVAFWWYLMANRANQEQTCI